MVKFILKLVSSAILLDGTTSKQAPKDSWPNRKMCLLGTEANENFLKNTLLKGEAKWQNAGQKQGSQENVFANIF